MDATTRERFETALARIEAGIAAERRARERAERRYAVLEGASEEAIDAIDALLAAPAAAPANVDA